MYVFYNNIILLISLLYCYMQFSVRSYYYVLLHRYVYNRLADRKDVTEVMSSDKKASNLADDTREVTRLWTVLSHVTEKGEFSRICRKYHKTLKATFNILSTKVFIRFNRLIGFNYLKGKIIWYFDKLYYS